MLLLTALLASGFGYTPPLESLLAALARAHGAGQPYRVESAAPGRFSQPPPADVSETLPNLPGVQTLPGPDGTPWTILQTRRAIGDGGDNIRIETYSLMQGGSPERRTSVEIWGPQFHTKASQLHARECVHTLYPTVSFKGEQQILEQKRTPHVRMKAQVDYLSLAQYVHRTLAVAGDVVIDISDPGATTLSSQRAGLKASIAPNSGELLGAEVDQGGLWCVVRFAGFLPNPVFPARHPREKFTWVGDDAPARAAAGQPATGWEVYSVCELIPELPPACFDWQSIAPKAVDVRGLTVTPTGVQLPPAGSSPKPVEPSRPMYRVQDGELVVNTPRFRGSRLLLLSAGSAAFILAGVAWLRRRMA